METGSHHGAADLSSWGQIQREEAKEDLNEEALTKKVELTLTVGVHISG